MPSEYRDKVYLSRDAVATTRKYHVVAEEVVRKNHVDVQLQCGNFLPELEYFPSRGPTAIGEAPVMVSLKHVFRRRNPLLRVEGLLKVLESTISTKFRIMFIKIGTFDLA